jgi:hypothetical protein
MQEAMHGQMAEMVIERLLFVVGFAAGGLVGDGDIAEHARLVVETARAGRLQRRKRKYIGWLVDAAPIAVERADAGIIGQHDSEFGVADSGVGDLGGRRNGALYHGFGACFHVPALGGNENL